VNASIVVLANERDFAADEIIRRLADRVRVRRLNIETARRASVGSWSPEYEADSGCEARVIWWRQFESDERPTTRRGIDDVLVRRAQWRTWLATCSGPRTHWVNDLWAARRAENKVEQLRAAAAVGLRVPRTAITNDPDVAGAFRDAVGESIVKTLSSAYFEFSDQSFVFTELLSDATLRDRELWFDVPVIVQESLRTGHDTRVVSFGQHCFAARCESDESDWRKAPSDHANWTAWTPPGEIVERCREYRTKLGLEYAAFDFMIQDDKVLFLEANQAGEWLFLDRTLELGIADAFADHLLGLASAPELFTL
jgi:glutathione synthase/RimK-type ligase-like ATP-grasp enzyme